MTSRELPWGAIMKSTIFLTSAAALTLGALLSGPASASLICTGSVIDDTGTPCDGSAVGLRIGRDGVGSMSVTDDSDMVVTPDAELAFVHVGRSFDGALAVSDGASFLVDGGALHATVVVGRDAGGTGELVVTQGSTFEIAGQDASLVVGREGTGTVQIIGAGVLVQGADTDIVDTGVQISRDLDGDGQAGTGSVLVDHGSLTVQASDAFMSIGTDGKGELTVQNDGVVNIQGTGGYGYIAVGRFGDGELNITGGSEVNVTSATPDSSVYVAEAPGSVGTVVVDGRGSTLDAGERLAIGYRFRLEALGGTGTVSLRNGGAIEATDIHVSSTGFLGGAGAVIGNIHNDGGVIGPGNSPGALDVSGDLTQNAGFLEIEIAGLGPGQYDILNVDGTVNFLGGSILFIFLDGFLPKANDIVDFLIADAILGLDNLTFAYRGAAPGFQFAVDGTRSGGLQFVAINDATAVPEPSTLASLVIGLFTMFLIRRKHARAPAWSK